MAEFQVSLDILHNILSRLPAMTLLRLRCVCKAWKSIIDDPLFIKSHTKNQQSSSSTILTKYRDRGALFCLSLDSLSYGADGYHYQELDVIPLKQIIHSGVPRLSKLPTLSCNGLILIPHKNIKKSWAIWNPLLQDFHLLPPPLPETDLKGKYESVLVTCGFGYDEGSDDYKVVRVDRFYGTKVYRTRVYSVKSRCWRIIDFPGGDCWGACGAFLDGALHWRSRHGMVTLDLGREVHRLVAPPPPSPNISNKERRWESLDALDGCLIWSCIHENFMGMEAWVMEHYGTDKSWTKLFSIEATDARGLKIVGYLKSKGQRQVFFRHWGDGLRWLDLENKCWRDIKISRVFCSSVSSLHSFLPCVAQFSALSLVRLDNHHKNKSGVKRKREKAYARSKEIVYYH